MLHGNVLFGSLECLLKTQLNVHFKKCPLSTQTFSHTFWQNGHALVYALAQRARKSSPLLVLMEFVSSYLHDCFTKDFTSMK